MWVEEKKLKYQVQDELYQVEFELLFQTAKSSLLPYSDGQNIQNQYVSLNDPLFLRALQQRVALLSWKGKKISSQIVITI
jgi:hypothetical protein